MKFTVYKAYSGAPKSTLALSKKSRDSISKQYGIELKLGYAAQASGGYDHCPRNLIVQRMKISDPLLNKPSAVRIGAIERKRLGVKVGGTISITPLKYETWYHGTRALNPVSQIVNGEWVVGNSGQGIWMSDQQSMAKAFAQTGLFTIHVSWGRPLAWPLPGDMAEEFELWCSEHNQNYNSIINNPGQTWGLNPYVLRWARLYGHYFVPYANARIFPGVFGEKFIGNRVRIMKLESADGRVLWKKWKAILLDSRTL